MAAMTLEEAKAMLKNAEKALKRCPRFAPDWQYQALRAEYLIARSSIRWWGIPATVKEG